MSFFVERRREVMQHIEKYMLDMMPEYLKPIDEIWQPSDFLPDSSRDDFFFKKLKTYSKVLVNYLMI